jgi:SAM-dependent methyltransferase
MNEDKNHYDYQGETLSKRKINDIEHEFKQQAIWYRVKFKTLLSGLPDGIILDAPCGHGNFLYFLRACGLRNFLGVDISQDRVAIAKSLGLPATQGDVFLAVKQGKGLAMIACIDFLEHIEKEKTPAFLEDCKNALCKGGVLLIRMPVGDSIFGCYDAQNDFTHKWSTNSNVIEGLLLQSGFSEVRVLDERPIPYNCKGVIRLPLYYAIRIIAKIKTLTFGYQNYKIWSRSAWFVAKAP